MAKRKPARAAAAPVAKPTFDPHDLPADFRELFVGGSSKWFRHKDIPGTDLEDEMVVTIEDITRGEVGKRGGEKKPQFIAKLEGQPKRLGLNTTNCNTIANLYGRNPRSWIGQAIVIFRDKHFMESEQEWVKCIRVRPFPPPGAHRTAPRRKAIKRRAA
jgi:hypothetical protein